jgi:DNA polymerase-3 subunit epsilon
MTAKLWITMLDDIQQQTGINEVPFSLIQKLSKTPKANIAKLLANYVY